MNIKSCETNSLQDIVSSGNDVTTLLNHKTVWIRLKTIIVNQIQLSLPILFLLQAFQFTKSFFT